MKRTIVLLMYIVLTAAAAHASELALLIPGVSAGGPEGPYQNYVRFTKFSVTTAGGPVTIVAEKRVDKLSSAIASTVSSNPTFRAMQGAIISDSGGLIELRIGGGKIEKVVTRSAGPELIEEITITAGETTPTYNRF